ncbi:site-specific integrase [archaeon]|nr:site-specific integrase [archaeon]
MPLNSKEAISLYEYLRLSGKSEGTAYNYARYIDKFVEFIGKPPEKATRMDVMEFMRYIREGLGFKDRSVAIVGWSLRAYYKMVGLDDMARWVPIPQIGSEEEPEWLPEDVVMELIDRVAVLVVAYDLALRLGEVVLLKADRYNKATGEIEVTRLKHKGRPNKYMLILDDWARDVLNEYLDVHGIRTGRIFRMTTRTIQNIFKRRLKVIGLDPNRYRFHVLRHSRATHIAIRELREKGHVDVLSLAKFMGHARIETTMRYVHLASKYLAFRPT